MPTITLSPDEALVLFEWSSRLSDTDKVTFEHPAERVALWNLTGCLEKVLAEPFHPDYRGLLAQARTRVVGGPEARSAVTGDPDE